MELIPCVYDVYIYHSTPSPPAPPPFKRGLREDPNPTFTYPYRNFSDDTAAAKMFKRASKIFLLKTGLVGIGRRIAILFHPKSPAFKKDED